MTTNEKITIEDMFEVLKDFEQLVADGMFKCKNKQGDKILVLYNRTRRLCISMNLDKEDHGFNFKETH